MQTSSQPTAGAHAAEHQAVDLRVRYIGARHPYEDPKAPASETLMQIKPRVLAFFRLSEGTAGGGTKTYVFAHDGIVLTNPNETLGTLADGHHELKLDLLEQFQQG